MQGPVDALHSPHPLLRPRQSTPTDVAVQERHQREFPYTVAKAKGRLALASGDMQPGERVGALDLGVFAPVQLQQTLGTTCLFRSAMNVAMAFGKMSQNPYLQATAERRLAEAATDAGLLNIFGANTHHSSPARMVDFLEMHTHLTAGTHHPTARFLDTQLVAALREGNAALALVYHEKTQRQEWEAFYAMEKTPDNQVFFHSAFSGTGEIITRDIQQMAQALYGTTASPELWLVQVQTPYPTNQSSVKLQKNKPRNNTKKSNQL